MNDSNLLWEINMHLSSISNLSNLSLLYMSATYCKRDYLRISFILKLIVIKIFFRLWVLLFLSGRICIYLLFLKRLFTYKKKDICSSLSLFLNLTQVRDRLPLFTFLFQVMSSMVTDMSDVRTVDRSERDRLVLFLSKLILNKDNVVDILR